MSKLSYWERRQVENMYRYMQSAEDIADQIAKLYLRSARWLTMAAEDIFERYMTKHNLSEAEARRLLNELRDKTSIDELIQKLEGKGDKKEVLAKLESPAYQARIRKLEELQTQLDQVMQNVYQQEKQISTSHYVDLANEAFYRTIFNLQQRAQAAFSFNYIDPKQIDAVVNSKWSGQNYSTRIWGNTRALAKDVKEELLINLVTGRTERETAEVIANKFAQGASNARRLVRTESAYLSAELSARAIKEAGVEEYQYMATLDLKTSEICRKMDLQIFKVSDRKVGVNCPPMHPWCRSTIVAVIDRKYLEGKKRAAIDPETGERILVPRNMTYEEWYKKYVKGKTKAETSEKKLKNKSSDQKQHERYRKVLGDNVPDKLDDFQEMKYNDGEKWRVAKEEYAQTTGARASGGKRYVPYDPEDKRDVAAAEEYRKISRRNDIERIAKNSGFTADEIRQVKRHIFFNKHKTYDGYKMLYPDYDMAVAWKRLYEGTQEERDILLLQHELLESKFEKEYDLTISEAHKMAKKEYDWEAKLLEDLEGGMEADGLL